MGQINHAKYDQSEFNIIANEASVISLNTDSWSKWEGQLLAAETIWLGGSPSCHFDIEEMAVEGAYLLTSELRSTFTGTFSAESRWYLSADSENNFTKSALIIGSMNFLTGDYKEEVSQSTDIGAHYYQSGAYKNTFTPEDLEIGGKFYLTGDKTNVWIGSLDPVIATETKTISIDVDLAPGSTVIIDSDTYDIFLDGDRILHLHSGDWFDELNRKTISVEVQGTGGSLQAILFYTERYL